MCNPVENLEVASDPILEPFALTREQSNNRADDSLARVKNAEQQVHVLPDAIAMSTHGSVHFTLGGEVCSIDPGARFGTLYLFQPSVGERAFLDVLVAVPSALCRCQFRTARAAA